MIVLVIILLSVCFTVKKEAELGRMADELANVNTECLERRIGDRKGRVQEKSRPRC